MQREESPGGQVQPFLAAFVPLTPTCNCINIEEASLQSQDTLALFNTPSVQCEAKSLKPAPNQSISYVLRAGSGESSTVKFSQDLPRKGLSRAPPRQRTQPQWLTVIEDSVDLLSSDFARRCGDRGDADTSRMEPTAAPSQVKSCVNSVSPDQRRN